MMYKKHYSKFLENNPNTIHQACHSHQYWPDVTRQATLDYWDDSARLADDKWDLIFSQKIPQTAQLIADNLSLPTNNSIVFAPNTHELLHRLISALYTSNNPVSILCSDSEFHSFKRQATRLEEAGMVNLTKIPTQPFETFQSRFIAAAKENQHDLIFCSQVFFDSGYALQDLPNFVTELAKTKTTIAIDGYHAFMAIPTDLSTINEKCFYIAGAYKNAQGGEGACFMHVPPNTSLRPIYTGWFADFASLESKQSSLTQYAPNAQRFAGSTMDFTPLYRLNASLKLFKSLNLTTQKIHTYIQTLQQAFLKQLNQNQNPYVNTKTLQKNTSKNADHGHFYAFNLPSINIAIALQKHLKQNNIITDSRQNKIRFGFAIYHNPQDYNLKPLTTFNP